MKYISTIDMPKEQWLWEHKLAIGSSDVGSILGVNPRRTGFDTWHEKTMEGLPEQIDNPHMRFGRDVEDLVAQYWMEQTKLRVLRDNKIRIHPDYDFLRCNLDRIIIDNHNDSVGILEIKSTNKYNYRNWQDNGFPLMYYCQVQFQYMVTGYLWGEVAIFIGEDKIVEREPIKCDPELISLIMKKCIDFWNMYVIPKIPPPLQNVADVLRAFPVSIIGKKMTATQELVEKIEQLKKTKEDIKPLEEMKEKLEQEIKLEMLDNELIEWNNEILATWKSSKPIEMFDVENFRDTHIQEICDKYIRTKSGTRRFLLK